MSGRYVIRPRRPSVCGFCFSMPRHGELMVPFGTTVPIFPSNILLYHLLCATDLDLYYVKKTLTVGSHPADTVEQSKLPKFQGA
jgi:hypothetical protein